jgi:predicted metal-dependent peptidase
MLEKAPFYGLLAMRWTLQADSQTEDLWVDGKTIGYNPQWVETASFDELMSGVAHGAHHIALLHHLRRCGRDDAIWQKACDIPVNAALRQGGFVLPNGCMVSNGDENRSAEEVYADLEYNKPKHKHPGQDDDDSQGQGQGQQKGSKGEVRDQPGKAGQGMDETERQDAMRQAMHTVAAAFQQAKSSGLGLPADIERQIKSMLYPGEDWREILRDYLRSFAKDDYSWSRPNRRFVGQSLYLPSMHSIGQLRNIVAAIDTSVSIDMRRLELFGGALRELVEEMKPESVTVIYCNAAIQRVDTFGQDEEIVFRAKGFGSTDLRPPFEYVEKEGLDPDVFLYFTDLEGPRPATEPPYPVIWLDQNRRAGHIGQWILDHYQDPEWGARFGHYIALNA